MGGRRKGRLSLALPRRTGAFTPPKMHRTCPRPSPAPVHFRMRGTGSCLPYPPSFPVPSQSRALFLHGAVCPETETTPIRVQTVTANPLPFFTPGLRSPSFTRTFLSDSHEPKQLVEHRMCF